MEKFEMIVFNELEPFRSLSVWREKVRCKYLSLAFEVRPLHLDFQRLSSWCAYSVHGACTDEAISV